MRRIRSLLSIHNFQLYLSIHISNANISDKTLELLARLKKIEGMSLQGNAFTDEGLKHLRGMTQLRSLWIGLSKGQITDSGIAQLGGLVNLHDLEIQNANVTDNGIQKLRGLTKLKRLYLGKTFVTQTGVNELKKALPELHVDYRERMTPARVVTEFVEAALDGNDQRARQYFPKPPDNRIESQTQPLREMLKLNPDWRFEPAAVLNTPEVAFVLGRTVLQGDRAERGILCFTLKNDTEKWGIIDIDFETVTGVERKIKRFINRNPTTKVWRSSSDPLFHVGSPQSAIGLRNSAQLKRLAKLLNNQSSKADSTANKSATFGPVIERTVNHSGDNCLIDLDTGRLFAGDLPPEVVQQGSKAAVEWAAEQGIDAGGGMQPEIMGLIGFDLIAFPAPNEHWHTKTAASLLADRENAFKASNPGNPVFLSAKGAVPATWILQTREGGLGILQILGFTDQPKGVKIRYKMVEQSAGSTTNPTEKATEAERPWGEAVEGVQVSLRPDKSVWKFGETPTFKAQVRNRGELELLIGRAGGCFAVEFDGRWYGWRFDLLITHSRFGPGQEYEIAISLDENWVLGRERLALTPGKHTIRVAALPYIPYERGVTYRREVRALSNPVEITIEKPLPGSQFTSGEALAVPSYAFTAACESPEDPKGAFADPAGVSNEVQTFTVLEVLNGKGATASDIKVAYRHLETQDCIERAIGKGERVILIIQRTTAGPPWAAIKALPDTPENRKAVKIRYKMVQEVQLGEMQPAPQPTIPTPKPAEKANEAVAPE